MDLVSSKLYFNYTLQERVRERVKAKRGRETLKVKLKYVASKLESKENGIQFSGNKEKRKGSRESMANVLKRLPNAGTNDDVPVVEIFSKSHYDGRFPSFIMSF